MKIRIVSTSDVISVSRFDGKFHNADVNIYDTLIRKHPHKTLGECCLDVFTASRSKRVYTESQFGCPYFSNADMLSVDPFMSCNYISKKYCYEEKALLKKNMILTGRVGAIGQISYVPKYWENFEAMASDNVYRICIKDEMYSGYIYAFLASKIGTLSFWKLATGGVQPYVTDSLIKTIPIPIFTQKIMEKVDVLMEECNSLRESAHVKKNQAITTLEKYLTSESKQSIRHISSKQLFRAHNRLDSQYQHEVQLRKEDNIAFSSFLIKEKAKDIFVGNRGKRYYVKDGVPFLSSSDMMLFNPSRYASMISTHTPMLKSMRVQKKDILISRSGTVGNTMIVSDLLEGAAISEHALRLRIDETKIAPEYIYAYLNTWQGQRKLKNAAYGSVIITLGEDFVGEVAVPIIDDTTYQEVVGLVNEYCCLLDEATRKEASAISLVEKEIDSWSE